MINNDCVVIGATLDTGNLGVSALFASTVKGIHTVSPAARIRLFDGVRNPVPQIVRLADGSVIELDRVGVRCNKTVWRKNHLFVLLWMALIGRCLPSSWRIRFWNFNPYIRSILGARAVLDITGGDSFSDIYGLPRMVLGSLRKILIILLQIPLVLLPQTYGPFNSGMARFLASWILRRASSVYSRDREGLDQIVGLVGSRSMKNNPQLCPDVAFTLDAIRPGILEITPGSLPDPGTQNLIGFNISGLLWNGGYSRDNMFGLSVDYRLLVTNLVEAILQDRTKTVVLVPHVFPEGSLSVESDPDACEEVFEIFKNRFPGRIFLLQGQYDQSEIKWIIGRCDFFLGSRMHACIAALSQGIPAIGLAYSKKFAGVYETVGADDLVIDLRNQQVALIKEMVLRRIKDRQVISEQLRSSIQSAKEQVSEMFAQVINPCIQTTK